MQLSLEHAFQGTTTRLDKLRGTLRSLIDEIVTNSFYTDWIPLFNIFRQLTWNSSVSRTNDCWQNQLQRETIDDSVEGIWTSTDIDFEQKHWLRLVILHMPFTGETKKLKSHQVAVSIKVARKGIMPILCGGCKISSIIFRNFGLSRISAVFQSYRFYLM
jgi:hypothetical protein